MRLLLLLVPALLFGQTRLNVDQVRDLPAQLAAIEARLDDIERQLAVVAVMYPSPRDGEPLVVATHIPPGGPWTMAGYIPGPQRLVLRSESATDEMIRQWGRGWLTIDGRRVLANWCWPEVPCETPPGDGAVYELAPDDPAEQIVRLWRAATR